MNDIAHDDLEQLWQAACSDWDNKACHDLFLQACHDRNQLGFAAKKYHDARQDSVREALATKRLGAVTFLATQALQTDRTEPRKGLPRWLLVMVAISTASGVGWLLYVLLH